MRLLIETEAWHKIQYYVDTCKTEVSGLGKVVKRGDDFVVTDVKIFEQTVSGAHSDIEAQALATFQYELVKAGENPADWVLWWHSHAKMEVFFSGRDTDTIDQSTDFRYMVSLVTNHKHELKARIDVFDPCRMYTDLPVEILMPSIAEATAKECQAQIDAKVKKPKREKKRKATGYVPSIGYQSSLLDDDDWWDKRPSKHYDWGKGYDEWWDEKTTLEQELEDARKLSDPASVQVATEMLHELEERGRKDGYTN